MSAGQYNFICEQYATFSKVITYTDASGTPINLTGYTAHMKVVDSSGTTILDLLSTGVSPAITLGGSAGTITIVVDDDTTADLVPSNYKYDLLIESGSDFATRLLEGAFVVKEGISD